MQSNLTTTTIHETPGAYAFGIPGSYQMKTALYRQIMNNISLKTDQTLLELSCTTEGSSKIIASLNNVQPDLMGGYPGLFEISSSETCIGRNKSYRSIPFADNSFKTVVCIGIFNLMSDHTGTMAEIFRLLEPEGRIIIADQWFRRTGPMFVNLLQQYKRSIDSRIYSPSWVTRLLKSNGFGQVSIYPAGATNFLCTAKALK
jgi:cyclopropane fatty-acyl-phospholipid synthase-like methyltransferase